RTQALDRIHLILQAVPGTACRLVPPSSPTRRSSDLRCGPGDDRVRVLDVAGLAVHAVGGVDLQALLAVRFHDLVHACGAEALAGDRKSTRLNSSHVKISYAVFCLKKKSRRATR